MTGAGAATRWRARLGMLSVACLAALAFASPASAEPALPGGFQDSVVFGGLHEPTAMRFSPDGRVFVAEKTGKIEVYDSLGDPSPELFADLRTEVYDSGDRGLLGLALDPNFPASPYVYVLYTYDHILGDASPPPRWGEPEQSGDPCPEPHGADACLVSGRLSRLTAEGDHSSGEDPLVEGWCQQFSSHSIGDLQFGPEGALYAGGGDGASFTTADYGQLGEPPNPCGDPPDEGGSLRAQDVRTPADPTGLNGAIIRVDPETGEGLSGNPMYASLDPNARRIFAFGFRNPFRFTIDPATDEFYVDNVGSSEFEEIDRFAPEPGVAYNSGWPCYEGPNTQYLFKELGLPLCESLYAEAGTASAPFFYYSHGQRVAPGDECPFASGSAIGGVSVYHGSSYPPAYDGALFFADSVRGCIYSMRAGEDGTPDPATVAPFLTEGSLYPGVDIEEGPEGDLYYVSLFGEGFGPGEIHRISYNPGAPTARLTATPRFGDTPLEAHFDAGASSDPTGEELEYEWDLDGDGAFDDGADEATQAATYAESENQVVAVRVTDGEGLSTVARVTIYPGDTPPEELEIVKPSANLEWSVGQKIEFEGSASKNHAHLPSQSISWSTRLLHCPSGPESCHAHPLQNFSGVQDGSFLAPDHDYPSHIEITLNAVDSRGLSASKTVTIDPRAVDLQIESDPPGISLSAGLLSGPAPFTLTAIEGSTVNLSAPPTQVLGGKTYTWSKWSDGGARSHTVLADESGYTAEYAVEEEPPGEEGTAAAQPPPAGSSAGPGGEPPVPPVGVKLRAKLSGHPAKETQRKAARFDFSANQAGVEFRCKLDQRPYRPCDSAHVTYGQLKPGRHIFRLLAVSGDGQTRAKRVFAWRVL